MKFYPSWEMASFLCSWISSFSLFICPLSEAALDNSQEPFLAHITKPFCKLHQILLQALALLLDLTGPFSLHVTEKEGYALGVLDHQLGPSIVLIAYLSKHRLHSSTMGTLLVLSDLI